MKRSWSWVLSIALVSFAVVGCGDDDTAPEDAGSDAGDMQPGPDSGTPPKPIKDAGKGPDKPQKDAGNPPHTPKKDAGIDASDGDDQGDAGDDEDGGGGDTLAREFHVPSGGGSFDYETPGGVTITFDFPASAAGKDITITALDVDELTFGTGDVADAFSEAIKLGPSGTTFADPVKVKVGKGALIVFNYSDTEEPGDPLQLSADGESLELTHFSTLGVVAPNQSCQSESGWNDVADAQECVGHGTATTRRGYGCKNFAFCYAITASCCVEPGDTDTDCQLGDDSVQVQFIRTGSNDGEYLYCDHPFGAGSGPYVQGYSPDDLVADSTPQEVTLTGTNFDQNGGFVIGGDLFIAYTWVSSTEVHATVPGTSLAAAGTLNMVGFVNPTPAASGPCGVGTTGNCDFITRSNYVNIPIVAPPQ